ncbi:MAG: S-layer homology domain-containing protein [Clostridia bacterium]|nr:S-layer homology domain-containing protein [Clostridia bacterium]
MNKNLKKVISAVAALAISASSIAAFAVNFPDVEETASYAQAVQELSALGVISGFDDGTFKPDELVTRAQISKMIVDALAEGKQAEASSNSSKFADVSDHWATGYINQGVTDGWIAGYSDTEFGPDDNVTYVQAQKMLVAATGYDIYATAQGGWPAGYKLYASSLDITSGVQGVTSDDQQLTRAQVAQMIDNAMDAPLCVIDRWEPNAWGTANNPILDVKDGEGKDYQTLFTEKHDAYKVYGRVTATSKTVSGLDIDKVMFKVEKADNFDDEYVKATDDREADEMFYGDTNAEDMLRTYAQALIQKNDDDEYTILSITAAAANKSVSLLAEDVDESKSDVDTDKVLYFFPTGTTRGAIKYQLADEVEYYVNGVEMGTFDNAALQKFIIDNDTAMVTLQKETATGSTNTSSKYNVIMITTYTTAVVDQVVDKTSETSINFKANSDSIKTKMTVNKDDDTYKYSFKLNGEEIDPAELQEFDVLSISYDVADGSKEAFADSTFYDVIVSRDNTAEGKYTGKTSAAPYEYTIGGEKYKAANGISVSFDTSTEYTLYLDSFGRIAYTDEISDSKKIGVLKSVYRKNNGDFVAEVITKDAQVVEYTMDEADALAVATKFNGTAANDSTFDSGLGKTNADLVKQVVEYKTTTSGKLTVKEYLAGKEETSEYKESSSKIGSVKVSDATTIIDLTSTKKDDYKAMTKDSLKNATTYTVYGYNKSTSDSSYRFVLLTDGIGGIDSTSELAVFVESGTDADEDGNDVDTMTVLVGGEKTTLLVDADADDVDVTDFAEGDALIFSTNTSGEIDTVLPVFAAKGVLNDADNYEAFRDGIFEDTALLNAATVTELEGIADSNVDEGDVSLAFGAVVKNGNGYTLANIKTDDGIYVDLSDDSNIDLDLSDATIYTYNFSNNKRNAGRLVLDDGMAVTPDVTAAYLEGDKSNDIYFLDNEDVVTDVVFAIVRTFNTDEAQEVYLIVAE